jgi:hypothetical protein
MRTQPPPGASNRTSCAADEPKYDPNVFVTSWKAKPAFGERRTFVLTGAHCPAEVC